MDDTFAIKSGSCITRMVKAYPADHTCDLAVAANRLPCTLIDINFVTARIQLEHEPGACVLRLDQQARLHSFIGIRGVVLNDIPCRIAWLHGREAGLEFDTRVDVGLLELQHALEQPKIA